MTDPTGNALERYEPLPVQYPSSEVSWRRNGSDTDLRFETPVGDRFWRRNAVPVGTIPFWSGLGWGVVGTGVGFTPAIFDAVAVDQFLPLIVAVTGVAGVVGGWLVGRRRQREVRARNAAIDAAAEALSQSYSVNLRGTAGAVVKNRIRETLRTGAPGSVTTFTGRGHANFRVQASGPNEIEVSPFVQTAGRNSFIDDVVQATAMPVTPQRTFGGTAPKTDARMADLERRLRQLEKAGPITSSHPAYAKLMTLKVDRMTDYRVLSSRLATVQRINTPQSQETAAKLEADLDQVVALMQRGVDDIEREVLADSSRESDAHIEFLRQKYGSIGDGSIGGGSVN